MTGRANLPPLRVLVVDDSALDREELRRLLLGGSERRYVFTEADSIASGLRELREAPAGLPDLVVLDYNLPDGTAADLLAALSDDDGHVTCPVLVMTGGEDATVGRQVIRAGAQDFLGKSWMTKESLTRAVENSTERWALAGELRVSQKRTEAALESAERAVIERDQLVSLVSHDLRNPLNVIVLCLSALEGHVAEEARSVPPRMERQARRMAKMLDELLDLSLIRAGKKLRLEAQDVDLVTLSREMVDELQQSSRLHVLEFEAKMPSLMGSWDRHRIERVIANLLSNAIKYSPRGGRVGVTLETVDEDGLDWAILQVSDEGIGIARSELASVFDWFFRGQNARRAGIDGVGVGLAGSRNIVELHHGTLTVASGLGTGSTFTMSIPLQPERLVTATTSPPSLLVE